MIPVTHSIEDLPEEHPSVSLKRKLIGTLIRNLKDLQKTRIIQGNRMVAALRHLLPETEQESKASKKARIHELTDEEKKSLEEKRSSMIFDLVRADYDTYIGIKNKITSKSAFDKQAQHMKHIKSFEEMLIVAAYANIQALEDMVDKSLSDALDGHPLWEIVKKKSKFYAGIGPKTIGMLVAYVDIRKATYATNLFAYIGLDVVHEADGTVRGRGRYKEHLVERTMIGPDGKEITYKGISFNPTLKTMLVGVTSGSMIRLGAPSARNNNTPSHWYELYKNYKHRITCREQALAQAAEARGDEEFKPRRPAHIEKMARRYITKKVLAALHADWRKAEGLPVYPSYEEGILGLKHHED